MIVLASLNAPWDSVAFVGLWVICVTAWVVAIRTAKAEPRIVFASVAVALFAVLAWDCSWMPDWLCYWL